MTKPNEQQLSMLSEDEFEDLFKRLLMFTHKRYGWLREKYGLDLQDMVHTAIIDTLEGKRRWPPRDSTTDDPERPTPTLLQFLCYVIESNVYDQFKKQRQRRDFEITGFEFGLEPLLEESEFGHEALPRVSDALFSGQDPENIALHHELTERIHNVIHSAVADDHDLAEVVDLLLDNPDYRPREIAKQLGLPMPKVYRLLKQLQKRLITIPREAING